MELPSSHALGLTHKLRAERYKKELEAAERKNENLAWANKDISRKLFEANQRGRQLAVTLGFRDIFEAETIVSRNRSASNHFRSEQQSLRLQQLERELTAQQEINSRRQQNQQEMLQKVKEDNDVLRVKLKELQERTSPNHKLDDRVLRNLPTTSNHSPVSSVSPHGTHTTSINATEDRSGPDDLPTDTTSLRLELIEIRHRYDSLMEAKQKAAAMYKRDYKKWRDYKRQVYEEATRDQKKQRYRNTRSSTKRKGYNSPSKDLYEDKIKPIHHEVKQLPRPHSRASDETVKENYVVTPTYVRHRIHPTSPFPSSPITQVFQPALYQLSSSPKHTTSVCPGSVLEQPSRDVLDELFGHTPAGGPSSKLKRKRSEPGVAPTPSPSSDTEDDSQAPKAPVSLNVLAPPISSENNPPRSLAHTPSFEIQDDSEAHDLMKKPPLPMRPKVQIPILKRFAAPAFLNNSISTHDLSAKSRRDTRHAEEPSSSRRRLDPWNRSRNSEQEVIGEKFEHRPTDRHVDETRKLGEIDYSEYKGRGRYAQTAQNDGNTTINAQYEIDANRNNGLDFQYDAVVRNRWERKHLDGGDCECCRDYYEAIGPLPPRLQQPLWRSPTSSPVMSRTCQRRGTPGSIQPPNSRNASLSAYRKDNDIAQHKKDISRHRHKWERASTPPGYWNIGFPSTQEASDINEKAKEMHRQKLAMVEQEANKMDGRYKKR